MLLILLDVVNMRLNRKIFLFFFPFQYFLFIIIRVATCISTSKALKLFDCLQCFSFPSMRENDKIRLISMFNLFCSFCCTCANNKYGINEID